MSISEIDLSEDGNRQRCTPSSGALFYIQIGRAPYKLVDAPVLIWDVPPDVTICLSRQSKIACTSPRSGIKSSISVADLSENAPASE